MGVADHLALSGRRDKEVFFDAVLSPVFTRGFDAKLQKIGASPGFQITDFRGGQAAH